MTEDSSYYEPYHYNIRESEDQHGKGVHIKITPNSNVQQVILKQTTLIKKLKDERNRYISTIEERNFIITQMVDKMKQYEGRIEVLSATVVEVLGQEYLNTLCDKENLSKLQATRTEELNKIKELKKNNQELKQEIKILRENRDNQSGDQNLMVMEKIKKENIHLGQKLQNLKGKYKRLKKQMKESKNLVNDIETIEIEQETVQMYEVQCQANIQVEETSIQKKYEDKIEQINQERNWEAKTKQISDLKEEVSLLKEKTTKLIQQNSQTFGQETKIRDGQIQPEPEALVVEEARADPVQSEKDKLITYLQQQITQLKQSALESTPKIQSSLPPKEEALNEDGDSSEKSKVIHDLKKEISKLKKKEKELKKLKAANQKLTSDLETLQFEEEAVQLFEVECQTQFSIAQQQIEANNQEDLELITKIQQKDKIIDELRQENAALKEQGVQKIIQQPIEESTAKIEAEDKQNLIQNLKEEVRKLNDQILLQAQQRKKDTADIQAKSSLIEEMKQELNVLKQSTVLKIQQVNLGLPQEQPQIESQIIQKQVEVPKVDIELQAKEKEIQMLKKQIESLTERFVFNVEQKKNGQLETKAKDKMIEQLNQEVIALKDTLLKVEKSNLMLEQETKVKDGQIQPEPEALVVEEARADPVQSEKDKLITYLQQQITQLKQSALESTPKIQSSLPPKEEALNEDGDSSEKSKVIHDLKKEISKLKKKEKELKKLKAANQKLTSDLETLQFEEEAVQLFEVECQTQPQYEQILHPLATQINNQSLSLFENSIEPIPNQTISNLQLQLVAKNNKITELQSRINFLNKMIIQLRQQSDSILKNLTQSAPVLEQQVNLVEKVKENEDIINKLKSEIELRQKCINENEEVLEKAKQFSKWVSEISEVKDQLADTINKENDFQNLKKAISKVIQSKRIQEYQRPAQEQIVTKQQQVKHENKDAEMEERVQSNGQFLAITDLENLPLLYIEKVYENPAANLNFQPIFISHQNMKNPPQPLSQMQSSQLVEVLKTEKGDMGQKQIVENLQNASKIKSKPNLSIQIEEQKPFKLPLMLAPASPKNTINFNPLLTRTEPYYNRNSATETQFLISNLKTVEKWKLQNLLKSSIKKINTVLSELESAPAVKEKNIRQIANNVGNQSLCQFFNNQERAEKKN